MAREFTQVGVVGLGTMGAGIAEVCARAACDVVVLGVSDEAVDAGRRRIDSSLERAVRTGRLQEDERDAVLDRLAWSTDYTAFADCELVVEAAPEDEALKFRIFRTLDEACRPSAVLASNTSSIPLVKMATVTNRPQQVVGVHFFNPVPGCRSSRSSNRC